MYRDRDPDRTRRARKLRRGAGNGPAGPRDMADRRKAIRLFQRSAECLQQGRDPGEALENVLELVEVVDTISWRVEELARSDPLRERSHVPELHDPDFQAPELSPSPSPECENDTE